MVREKIAKLIEKALGELQTEKIFPEFGIPDIRMEPPEAETHGDYATNISFSISKAVKRKPFEIAEILANKIKDFDSEMFENIEAAEPGFINFFLSEKYLQKSVGEILKKAGKFGEVKIGRNEKINLEFISANPTGPLTLGNGRGGFGGDVLANVLNKAGFKASREYYINDVGEQVRKLGHSVIGDSEAVYKGDYILNLRERIKENDPERVGEAAAGIILNEMIKPIVKKMGINYDVWFSEKSLHKNKEVGKTLDWLKGRGLAYEKDGALWFKSTKFGDDKDRVLVKEGGETTYLASDIAYMKNKFRRGFGRLIYIWGADHHGYINRMKAAAEALGHPKEKADIIIMQLVRLFKEGKEVRMSKRAGTYVTLEELLGEVNPDAARFFFIARNPGSHLNFDLDLAKEQSEKNPVFYVQYAHARICSIINKISTPELKASEYKLLSHPSELALIKKILILPEVIGETAKDYQIQRIPQYAVDLAEAFHQFYRDCRVLTDEKALTRARLSLALAAKIVLRNTLDLMGISSPEKM